MCYTKSVDSERLESKRLNVWKVSNMGLNLSKSLKIQRCNSEKNRGRVKRSGAN